MAYHVDITKAVWRQIDRLSHDVRNRVLEAIDDLSHNPRPHGCKKLVARGEWRIAVGDWRIIYEIHDHVLIVKVVRVSHRSKAY